jgi:hypothetical protein
MNLGLEEIGMERNIYLWFGKLKYCEWLVYMTLCIN